MADIVPSLFGVTPEMYQQQQAQQADRQAMQYAQLTPMQQATYAIGRGAYGLAGALGGALGAQDPQLQMISARNAIAQQIDLNNPESIMQGVRALSQAGDTTGAMQLADVARKLQSEMAQTFQRTAAGQASLSQAAKTERAMGQEDKLRQELSGLGPAATEADIRAVLVKYGDPDKVLASLQASATREADREARADAARLAAEARVEAARVAANARLEAAREAGANRAELARIAQQGRTELAQLTASLKGPSAAVLKAQERAEKIAEGQVGLEGTIATAKTLVEDLTKLGGMTSTSKQPLANLVTSLGTGTVGQMTGRAFGTQTQAKRDELKSIRLQLLNAVKEATGMGAQQLNSNVELKTWLDSLGGEGMTREANLAILDNIATRYLKGQAAAPKKDMPDPLGIR